MTRQPTSQKPGRILSRRAVLKAGLGLVLSAPFISRAELSKAEAGAQLAHNELWRRLIDRHGVMLDFSGLDGSVIIPTAEECREGKPNALGWWSPIENGAFFNGLYIDALLNRWHITKDKADAEKIRLLAQGLMTLASISEVKGFVGRGLATDGKGHYPMGSNDQTGPWFYGLWRYLESGLPDKVEHGKIVAKVIETAEIIIRSKWQMPAEEPFRFRGGFGSVTWESSARLLFVLKLLQRLTGDEKWAQLYRQSLSETGKEKLSRLAICERGMIFEYGGRHSWTASVPVAMLRGLWEMETDAVLKQSFAKGLQAGANVALESLPLGMKFDNEDQRKFEHNWRVMNQWWKPQKTEKDATDVAHVQSREFGKMSPRRGQELSAVREPAFAAWVVTLAPDKQILKERRADLEKLVAHYRYDRLIYSQFFPTESVWWQLRQSLG